MVLYSLRVVDGSLHVAVRFAEAPPARSSAGGGLTQKAEGFGGSEPAWEAEAEAAQAEASQTPSRGCAPGGVWRQTIAIYAPAGQAKANTIAKESINLV